MEGSGVDNFRDQTKEKCSTNYCSKRLWQICSGDSDAEMKYVPCRYGGDSRDSGIVRGN